MNKRAFLSGYTMNKSAGVGREFRIAKDYFNKYLRHINAGTSLDVVYNNPFVGRPNNKLRKYLNDNFRHHTADSSAFFRKAVEGVSDKDSVTFNMGHPDWELVDPLAARMSFEDFSGVMGHEFGHAVSADMDQKVLSDVIDKIKKEYPFEYDVVHSYDKKVQKAHDGALRARRKHPERVRHAIRLRMKNGPTSSTLPLSKKRYDDYIEGYLNKHIKHLHNLTAGRGSREIHADVIGKDFSNYMKENHPGVYERLESSMKKLQAKHSYKKARRAFDEAFASMGAHGKQKKL